MKKKLKISYTTYVSGHLLKENPETTRGSLISLRAASLVVHFAGTQPSTPIPEMIGIGLKQPFFTASDPPSTVATE